MMCGTWKFSLALAIFGNAVTAPDYSALANLLTDLETSAEREFKANLDGYYGARLEMVRRAIPRLSNLQREALKLLMITGSATDHSALNMLRDMNVPRGKRRFGLPDPLELCESRPPDAWPASLNWITRIFSY